MGGPLWTQHIPGCVVHAPHLFKKIYRQGKITGEVSNDFRSFFSSVYYFGIFRKMFLNKWRGGWGGDGKGDGEGMLREAGRIQEGRGILEVSEGRFGRMLWPRVSSAHKGPRG